MLQMLHILNFLLNIGVKIILKAILQISFISFS